MIRTFYVLAWFLLIGWSLASILIGTFDALSVIAASIVAVGLVYAFALWAVLNNPHSARLE